MAICIEVSTLLLCIVWFSGCHGSILFLLKKQQEQLKNIKLPSNANWAQLQQPPTPAASSVLEIQKMQEEKERVEREQEVDADEA